MRLRNIVGVLEGRCSAVVPSGVAFPIQEDTCVLENLLRG